MLDSFDFVNDWLIGVKNRHNSRVSARHWVLCPHVVINTHTGTCCHAGDTGKKAELRSVKGVAKGHTAGWRWSQGLKLGHCVCHSLLFQRKPNWWASRRDWTSEQSTPRCFNNRLNFWIYFKTVTKPRHRSVRELLLRACRVTATVPQGLQSDPRWYQPNLKLAEIVSSIIADF